MGKVKSYSFSDFATKQSVAVQSFLHHAHDHMIASRKLRVEDPIFLDSSAYLCHLAFELFFKAIYLMEEGQFKGTHKLDILCDGLGMQIISMRDKPLLNVIDKYSFVRYPVDYAVHKTQKRLRLGGYLFAIDEIGTSPLEKADKLFCKIWRKLERNKAFKQIIKNIYKNPYTKGNRILMSKPR